jgi:hypothetical protein
MVLVLKLTGGIGGIRIGPLIWQHAFLREHPLPRAGILSWP